MAAVQPTLLHQVFNQSLLSRRAMPADVALEMYKRAIGVVSEHDSEFTPQYPANTAGLSSFLDEITQLLEPIGMAVKKGFTEDAGKQWIVLCNTESGSVSQLATDLTPLEISFVRELISAIVASYPANSLGSAEALSLTRNLNGHMSKASAEQLLLSLVSRGWFARSERGRYSLGTRGLLELDHYLREQFQEDINECKRCERLMMTGIECVNGECDAHLHKYCFKQLKRARASCPGCGGDLSQVSEIGEDAIPRRQDDWQQSGPRKKARPSRVQDDGDTQGGATLERQAVKEESRSLSQRSVQ